MNYTRRILFSGGAGFIGNQLVRYLVKNHPDWLIVNFDYLSYAGVIDNLNDIENEENYCFEYGSVEDDMFLSMIFANYAITDAIHLAASSHVDNSISAPMEFLYTNTVGTVTLLETARQYWNHAGGGLSGHKFYYFSTDEVFGFLNNGDRPFTEESKIAPSSPYSASKAAGDLFVKSYHTTYGMETLISHCCNVCAGRQFPEKMIPATIERILNGEDIIVYDEGLQSREWIYIDDVIDAAMCVFENGVPGESYNIGSGNEVKNIDLVNMLIDKVCEKTSKDPKDVRNQIKYVKNARPGHDFRYAIDCSKIKSELGWEGANNDINNCLEKTVDWYLNNQDWVELIKSGEYKKHNQEKSNQHPW